MFPAFDLTIATFSDCFSYSIVITEIIVLGLLPQDLVPFLLLFLSFKEDDPNLLRRQVDLQRVELLTREIFNNLRRHFRNKYPNKTVNKVIILLVYSSNVEFFPHERYLELLELVIFSFEVD